MNKSVLAQLRDVVGDAGVITAPAELTYYTASLSGVGDIAPAVALRPVSVDDLGRVVRILTDAGIAVVARGAGFAPDGARILKPRSAVIDLTALNQILEINEADRTVTVETGCTWAALYDALKARGLRTPVFGARNGGPATVGGALSTNLIGYGSGAHGALADHVLSVDVVMADGTLVETGAAAGEGRTAFLRHFGPDLTGVFLGDEGAFGIKARVTLRLIPMPTATETVAFAFERFEDIAEAQVALARENIAAEQWGFDPSGNDALAAAGFKFLDGLSFEREVTAVKGGMGQKLATLSRSLVDGHRMVIRGGYSLHIIIDGDSAKDVELKAARVRRLLAPSAMKELPGGVAQALHEAPFAQGPEILSAAGELALPLQGLFPLSRAMEMAAITDEYFVRHRDLMKQHGVRVATVTTATGNAFVMEPMFYWRDRPNAFHLRHAGREQRMAHGATAPNSAARDTVATLRRDLALLWGAFGASTFQLGGTLAYCDTLSSAAGAFTKTLKTALDPKSLINPGSLGLGIARKPTKTKFAEFPQNIV